MASRVIGIIVAVLVCCQGTEQKPQAYAPFLPEQRNECHKPSVSTCEAQHTDPPAGCFYDMNKQCEDEGGHCHLSWQDRCDCDYAEMDKCGEGDSTFCCVDCSRDNTSMCAKFGRECMKTCGRFQYENMETRCKGTNCKCCAPCQSVGDMCEALGTGSKCVSHEGLCLESHYIDTKACEGPCVCCVPCKVKPSCKAGGGYPERRTIPCKDGYDETDEAYRGCKCCKPGAIVRGLERFETPACVPNGERNLTDGDFCVPGHCPANYLQYSTGSTSTTGEKCNCCIAEGGWQRCKMSETCKSNRGYCTWGECRRQCPSDAKTSGCTSIDDVPCHCCVHEDCAAEMSP